jgi:hypothetical protein
LQIDEDDYYPSDAELEEQARERERHQDVEAEDQVPVKLPEQPLALDGGMIMDDDDLSEAAKVDRDIQAGVHKEMRTCVGYLISDLQYLLKNVNVS